jgi:uncharacterized protein
METDIFKIKMVAIDTFVMDKNSIHGVHHWEEVHDNGVMLAQQSGVDLLVVRLFAYLHDCKREDDLQDPEHGDRSADFCTELRKKGDLDFLSGDQFTKLWTACKLHHTGSVTADPTIGTCFDADRIELIRCGITPRVDLMSTPMGIRIAKKMNDLKTSRGH